MKKEKELFFYETPCKTYSKRIYMTVTAVCRQV